MMPDSQTARDLTATDAPGGIKRQIIANGAQVMRTEAEALNRFAGLLDDSFARAILAMLHASGRVVVSGMGKSGHIARKISSTFASTGTPSLYVHPGEASHGDLGMIAKGDVVLLLSNSGETPELADIIAYTRRNGIMMIGVAGRAGSTLLKKADIAILLPTAQEACPNGLAPTTSTTMTLAMGDAMAVALMKERGFTADNYRDFHPGGSLGALLATVGDLMHHREELPLIALDTPMSEALLLITSKGFGVAGVLGPEGRLRGIITDGDLRRHMADLLSQTAGNVMTANPKTIQPTARAADALATMNARKITTLFVVDGDGQPEGIIHIHDCLRAGIM